MTDTSRRTLSRALAVLTAVALVAGAALVFTIPRGADAANFKDTPDWAADQINWLVDNGIARGYTEDNTFRPKLNITRAQAAFWFGNYNNTIEIVERGPVGSSGNQFTHHAACPAGKRAVAGGGTPTPPSIDLLMTASQPVLTTGGESRWVTIWTTRNRLSATASFTLWALCIPDALS